MHTEITQQNERTRAECTQACGTATLGIDVLAINSVAFRSPNLRTCAVETFERGDKHFAYKLATIVVVDDAEKSFDADKKRLRSSCSCLHVNTCVFPVSMRISCCTRSACTCNSPMTAFHRAFDSQSTTIHRAQHKSEQPNRLRFICWSTAQHHTYSC